MFVFENNERHNISLAEYTWKNLTTKRHPRQRISCFERSRFIILLVA